MTVTLQREYASPDEAETVRRALAADRPEYLVTERDGSTLRCRVAAPSAASARATMDDLLSAIQLAERTRQVSSPASPRSAPDRS